MVVAAAPGDAAWSWVHIEQAGSRPACVRGGQQHVGRVAVEHMVRLAVSTQPSARAGPRGHAASPGSQWPSGAVQASAAIAVPSAIAGSSRWHAALSPEASRACAASTAEPSSGDGVRPRPSSSITMWVSTGPAPAPP